MSFLRQWSKQDKEKEQENEKADEAESFPSPYTSKDYAKDPERYELHLACKRFLFCFCSSNSMYSICSCKPLKLLLRRSRFGEVWVTVFPLISATGANLKLDSKSQHRRQIIYALRGILFECNAIASVYEIY